MNLTPRTIGEVVRTASDYLAARDIYEPGAAVECLMARLLRCRRLELYVRFDSALTDTQLAAMRRGVKRLAAGEPVQYVIGEAEFMDRTFKVDQRALIPRPETETLTRRVIDEQKLWGSGQPPVVADFGTGSGCIVITLCLERPDGRYVAIDSDARALELAADNARRHGPKTELRLLTPNFSIHSSPTPSMPL
ncbi:MAG: methyltransferase domain-containing protein [Lentisphaerales bacterium]|nr:MAG: methyltransferase domain-containing protein [Lentisphaerales bacterium]